MDSFDFFSRGKKKKILLRALRFMTVAAPIVNYRHCLWQTNHNVCCPVTRLPTQNKTAHKDKRKGGKSKISGAGQMLRQ